MLGCVIVATGESSGSWAAPIAHFACLGCTALLNFHHVRGLSLGRQVTPDQMKQI